MNIELAEKMKVAEVASSNIIGRGSAYEAFASTLLHTCLKLQRWAK